MHRYLTLFACMASFYCSAQGYKIELNINGLKDTTAYLGYFLQEKTFVRDTSDVDRFGNAVFRGDQTLPQGMYFFVLGNSRVFDFVVGEDQHFQITTNSENYGAELKVTGDEDNRLFFENMQFNASLTAKAEPHLAVLKDSIADHTQKQAAEKALVKFREQARTYNENIIDKYPNTLTARLLKMNKPVDIPEPPKLNNGEIDSTFQLRYYRKHYFDNFDLSDEAMLRLPKVFYWQKVDDYLSKLFHQHPDTITNAIDGLVSVAKKNKETYKYLVWNCLVNYQEHEIMGLDEVYVNVVDKYVSAGEMDYWLDRKTVQNLKNLADKKRRGLIGRPATNLLMQDVNFQRKSMFDIKSKYTVIYYFWTQCGHCREETPKLVDLYNAKKTQLGFEVFAVASDTSMTDIRNFIKTYETPWTTVCGPRTYTKLFPDLYYAEQTPAIYILDENKKIIARRLPVSQLEHFMTTYERLNKIRTQEPGG